MGSPYFVLMGKVRPAISIEREVEKKDLILSITAVIAICAILYGLLYTANKYYIPILQGEEIYTDYSVYYEAAQSFHNDPNGVYRNSAPHLKGGSFNYPPFSLILFYPLSYLSFPLSYTLFSIVNTLCCAAVGWFTLKIMKEHTAFRVGFWYEVFFLFLCMGLTPVVQNAKHAQINGIIALISISAIYLALRKSYVTAMVLVSIGFGLKLYPILLSVPIISLILFDKESHNKMLIIMYSMLGFFAVQVLSLVIIPLSLYEYYFTEYITLLSNYTCLSGFNQSFSGIVMRFLTPDFNAGSWKIVEIAPIVKVTTVLIQLTGIVYVFFAIKKKTDKLQLFSLCSLIMVSMPLFSPLGWEYVYVMCLPLLGSAFMIGFSDTKRNTIIMSLTNICIVAFCIPKIGDDALVRLQTKLPDFIFHLYYSRWFLLMILLSVVVYRFIITNTKGRQSVRES